MGAAARAPARQCKVEESAAGADRRRAGAHPRAHPCEGASTCRDLAGTCSAGTSSTDTICAEELQGASPKTKWAVLAFCAAGFWTSTRRRSGSTGRGRGSRAPS